MTAYNKRSATSNGHVGRVCLGAIYGEILTHGLYLSPYPVYFPSPIFHSKVMPPLFSINVG